MKGVLDQSNKLRGKHKRGANVKVGVPARNHREEKSGEDMTMNELTNKKTGSPLILSEFTAKNDWLF